MARHEEDREDLLREATALFERVEIHSPQFAEPVVVGFRRDGCASFFFGADPVLQFNTRNELRRAYLDGAMLKAVAGKLARLTKVRSATETALVRHDLDAAEIAAVLSRSDAVLQALAAALADDFTAREVPAAGVIDRVRAWLANRPPLAIAAAPNAR